MERLNILYEAHLRNSETMIRLLQEENQELRIERVRLELENRALRAAGCREAA